jgi:hypothetical protein
LSATRTKETKERGQPEATHDFFRFLRGRVGLVGLYLDLAREALGRVHARPTGREYTVLAPVEPCTGCGRKDWVVSVVMNDGERFCFQCLTGGAPATRRMPT